MRDPIIIEPPDLKAEDVWQECKDHVEKQGGLVHEDGEPNLMAMHGADPGVCSCPSCGEYYWKIGDRVQCLDCDFIFPTDWWAMYSWGCTAARYIDDPPPAFSDPGFKKWHDEEHVRRMSNAYYRYGFENPTDNVIASAEKIDLLVIVKMENEATHD